MMGLDTRSQKAVSGSLEHESGAGVSPLPPPPYGGEGALELRGSLDCWACAVLVTVQNLLVGGLNILFVGVIFGLILLPAGVLLGFGFLCHSKVGGPRFTTAPLPPTNISQNQDQADE